MAKTTKSFRLDNRVISDLEKLTSTYNMTQTEVIEQAVKLVDMLTRYSELESTDAWKIKGYLKTCDFWEKE